jgi:hypothetical protein
VPTSFYIFLVASFIALIPAWFDHGETWEEIKSGDKNKKCQNLMKLSALWIIPILTIIGTVYLGIESVVSDRQEKRHEADLTSAHKDIINLSNQVQQISSEYNEATNALAQAKQTAVEASNAINNANIAVLQNLNRHLSNDQKNQLLKTIRPYPKLKFFFFLADSVTDSRVMANDLAQVFVFDGWKSEGNAGGMMGGMPDGIGFWSDATNNVTVKAIADTMTSFGLSGYVKNQSGAFDNSLSDAVMVVIGQKPEK